MTLGKSPGSMLNLFHFERREIALDFRMLERFRYTDGCGCTDQFCLGKHRRRLLIQDCLVSHGPHCSWLPDRLKTVQFGHWSNPLRLFRLFRCLFWSETHTETPQEFDELMKATYISKLSGTASSKWLPISTHYFHVEKRSNNRCFSPHGIQRKSHWSIYWSHMQLISANIRGISGSPHPSLAVELMEPEIVTRLHKNSHLLRVVLFRGKRRCNPEKNGLGRCCWYSIEHCHSWISNDFNGSLSDL